jgi:hypothetical protein
VSKITIEPKHDSQSLIVFVRKITIEPKQDSQNLNVFVSKITKEPKQDSQNLNVLKDFYILTILFRFFDYLAGKDV